VKALTPNEKKLYWTMWAVVALVAAIFFSLRDKPLPKAANDINVVLDAGLRERFSEVYADRGGLDHIDVTFQLNDAFLSTVVRFEKEMNVAYIIKRGELALDRGEFRIVIKPLVKMAIARFPNRKKVTFDTVHLQLPH